MATSPSHTVGQSEVMSVVEHLHRMGGAASRKALTRVASRTELEAALAAGDIVRIARGRYALAESDRSAQLIAVLGAALGRTSAAVHHGWAVKTMPSKPHLVVPRWRSIDPQVRSEAYIHPVRELHVCDDGLATDIETTLRDCLRHLPFDEALSVADSALRSRVPRSLLRRIGESASGPGAPRIRRVAAGASALAANPFESALRAIALDVPGLNVEPQVTIREPGLCVRPDLVDKRLRLVLEADSFEWHGGRSALARDARRYNLLVINGWIVLRFAWEDVMHDQAYVKETLNGAVSVAELLNQARPAGSSAA